MGTESDESQRTVSVRMIFLTNEKDPLLLTQPKAKTLFFNNQWLAESHVDDLSVLLKPGIKYLQIPQRKMSNMRIQKEIILVGLCVSVCECGFISDPFITSPLGLPGSLE